MLKIHFLNVGHGDCTFVELPSGRLMMIDVNNSKSLPDEEIDALAESKGLSRYDFSHRLLVEGKRSWEDYYKSLTVDPYEYYIKNFSGRTIFRYIQTHPDMDHMSGLYRFFFQGKVGLENFWDVEHDKELMESDFGNGGYDYRDWQAYSRLRSGVGPDDSRHKVICNLRGSTGQYWTEDNISILSPTQDLIDDCSDEGKYNNVSYVLKIQHAGRSVIFPGDAESPVWDSILEEINLADLGCDILKASHHGRKSGYHEEAVNAMGPSVVVCSVGKKPETDASLNYSINGGKVFSTRYHGTITVAIRNDGDVRVENYKGEMID